MVMAVASDAVVCTAVTFKLIKVLLVLIEVLHGDEFGSIRFIAETGSPMRVCRSAEPYFHILGDGDGDAMGWGWGWGWRW